MAIFQTVKSMRARLGFPDRPDVNEAILSVLQDTTLAIKAGLRTELERVTVIDEFMLSSKNYGRSQLTRLIKVDLSRGFVDEAEPITAFLATTRAGLDSTDARLDLRDIGTFSNPSSVDSMILEDAERGRMIFTDVLAQHSYIRVTYTAGLLTEGGDPDIYAGQPDWLQYLASIRSELLALSNPLLNPSVTSDPNNRQQFEAPRVTELRRSLDDGFHDHVCIGPGYVKPIRKTVTAVVP